MPSPFSTLNHLRAGHSVYASAPHGVQAPGHPLLSGGTSKRLGSAWCNRRHSGVLPKDPPKAKQITKVGMESHQKSPSST